MVPLILEVGGNKILVAVYGPRESYIRRLLEPNTGVIRCRYNMAPFSVDDRKRPGPDRRSSEISKITADALRPALMLENYPRSMVDIYIEVIEAEGGTRCAGITAASVALVDAGVPMKDIVVGCAAGKVYDEIVLDLSEKEDKEGQADVPIAMMPRTGEITESITKLILNDKREDGRALDEYRDISIETDVISKAEGSARVKIGGTQVIVGIKPQLGSPFPDTPDLGVLMTNCEMLPMADPNFEPGPPSDDSIELARVVDRGIRESELVDLDKLCVEEGKHVWMLFIDLHIIDNCGNLFDACELAVMAALKSTKLPVATIVDDEVVISEDETFDLPINNEVAMCTFVKIGDKMVIDPTLAEEKVASARLNVGVTKEGRICAMQKGGSQPLTKDEILTAVNIAVSKTKELVEYL